MRITAAEVLEKKALQPSAAPGRPQQTPMSPQAPAGAEQQADPAAGADAPASATSGDPNQGTGDLQQMTQRLLNDYFDDQRIADVSHQVQQLIPLVGPEHAEKFVKVFSDWIKAAQVLKANLMAMVVMATPGKMMENQMSNMMNQLMKQQPQNGTQPLKVPLT